MPARTQRVAKRAATSPARIPAKLRARLAAVKLFLCDVDGVLTDGTVMMGDGKEFKAFNIQDGLGLVLLRRAGVKVGWVSNRPSSATQQRADDLKVDFLFQGKGSKVAAVESILSEAGVAWSQVCYMGDDVVDLGVLKRAGLAVSPSNGINEVKAVAHHVTQAGGGQGAVRELIHLLLAAQGKWDHMVREHSA